MKRFLVRIILSAVALAGAATHAHAALPASAVATATDAGGGSVRFEVVLPSGQAFVELFVRQNDVQNIAYDITPRASERGDGTSSYAFTMPSYKLGDRLEYRFYHYLPALPGQFTPGPGEGAWQLLVYGSNQFVTVDSSYHLGPYTMGSGGANDIEVFDVFAESDIRPVSTGWELVRANPSPFSAPLLDNAAGILAVYVRKCDGSGWVDLAHTPFAVASVSERVDLAAGRYGWSGTFNAELPGQRVDPTYECGGYDTVVRTLIGPQTLRTATTVEFAYVLANKL